MRASGNAPSPQAVAPDEGQASAAAQSPPARSCVRGKQQARRSYRFLFERRLGVKGAVGPEFLVVRRRGGIVIGSSAQAGGAVKQRRDDRGERVVSRCLTATAGKLGGRRSPRGERSVGVAGPVWLAVWSGVHFSFGAGVLAECSWELSRLLNSMRGRQAARKQRELAETGLGRRGAAGLNGCWRDSTCQAAIRILRATADLAGFLPARLARSS
jgi:hypothetical protein